MYKKIIGIICLCLVAFALVLPCFAEEQKPLYVALGDSISNGYGLINRERDTCVFIVGRHYGYKTVNCGVDGLTAEELLENIESNTVLRESIASASLITLEIGSNDLLYMFGEIFDSEANVLQTAIKLLGNSETKAKIEQTTIAVIDRLNSIFIKIRELNSEAKLVVAEIYNPWYGMDMPILPSLCEGYLERINSSISAYAQDYSFTVAEVYRPFKEQKLVCGSFATLNLDPHPTAEGHRVYAECLIRAIDKETGSHLHSYGDWQMGDAEGHTMSCECGHTAIEKHNYGKGTVIKKATHTEQGEEFFVCAVCGFEKTEAIEKTTMHIYSKWESIDGETHKKICECKKEETEAHIWSELDEKEDTESRFCIRCNEQKAVEKITEPQEKSKGNYIWISVAIGLFAVFALTAGTCLFVIKKRKDNREKSE